MRARELLTMLLFLSPLQAQSQEEAIPSRVDEINQIVEKHTIDLKEKQSKKKGIEDSYNRVKGEVRSIQNKQASLKKELDDTKSQLSGMSKEIELAADNIESLERKYAARIRALYMQRSEDLLQNVFVTSDQTSIKRNAYFMSRIKESDQKIINDLFVLKTDRQSKIQDLSKILKQKEEIQEKAAKQAKLLSAKLTEQESTLKEFNAKKAELEQTIASLKAQALRIETVLTSLTGKEKQDKGKTKENEPKQGLGAGKLEAFVGDGLDKLKGQIEVPVARAKLKDTSTADGVGKILGAKGLTFTVPPSSDVEAVENGKVIFNSVMPGRGKMIIIDHGQRSYSLYGKLSETSVKIQEEVEKGDNIAKTEESEGEEGEFYFEIRKNGIAVDTRSYLKTR